MVAGGMGGWVERMLERRPFCVGSLSTYHHGNTRLRNPRTRVPVPVLVVVVGSYSSSSYSRLLRNTRPSTRTRRRRLALLLLELQVAEVVRVPVPVVVGSYSSSYSRLPWFGRSSGDRPASETKTESDSPGLQSNPRARAAEGGARQREGGGGRATHRRPRTAARPHVHGHGRPAPHRVPARPGRGRVLPRGTGGGSCCCCCCWRRRRGGGGPDAVGGACCRGEWGRGPLGTGWGRAPRSPRLIESPLAAPPRRSIGFALL